MKEKETPNKEQPINNSKKKQSLSKLTIYLLTTLTRLSTQARAPLQTPRVQASAISTDSTWQNTNAQSYLSTGKASKFGDSTDILFTSSGIPTTSGPAFSIYDSSSTTTVTVSISGDAEQIRILGHSAGYESGNQNFVIIDKDSDTVTTLKLYSKNVGNSPTISRTLPSISNPVETVLYFQTADILVVGTLSGVYTIKPIAGTSYTQVTALGYMVYKILERDIAGSNYAFTASFNNKEFYAFDYTDEAAATTHKKIVLASKTTSIAQSKLTPLKMLLGLDYADESKNIHYLEDWTSEAITSSFDTLGANPIPLDSIWGIEGSDAFYVAMGTQVFFGDVGQTLIEFVDVTSKLLQAGETMTSIVYFQSLEYYVIAGFKGTQHAFIKRFEYIGECDTSCATCSFGEDNSKCITCDTNLYFFQPDANLNNKFCLEATSCQAEDGYYTRNDTFVCVSAQQCKDAGRYLVDEWSDCVDACPTSHPYLLDLEKKCYSGTGCQAKTDYYTKNSTNTCVLKADCSDLTIEAWSDCTTACPSGAGEIYLYAEATNSVCLSKVQCTTATKYTDIASSTCIAETDCVSPKFKITSSSDCVAGCSGRTPPLYEHNQECITATACQVTNSLYTQNTTSKCIDATTCTTTDSAYIVEEFNDCVPNCGATTGALHPFTDADNKKCYTGKQCQTLPRFTKNDTYECLTADQCTTTNSWKTLDEWNDCVSNCMSQTNHKWIDKDDANNCITNDVCTGARGGYTRNDTTYTCIADTACTGTGNFKIAEWKDCAFTCAAIQQYSLEAINECVTEAECKGYSTGGDHYARKADYVCVDLATCIATSYAVPTTNDCVADCETEATSYPYSDLTSKLCLTLNECKASVDGGGTLNRYVYEATKDCLTSAECNGLGMNYNDQRECTNSCPTGEYAYNSGTENFCVTAAQCITYTTPTAQHYTLAEGVNSCIPKDTCVVSNFIVEDTKECVSSCAAHSSHQYEDVALKKCFTKTQCQNYEEPAGTKVRVAKEDTKSCITPSDCTTTLSLKTILAQRTCVASCIGQTTYSFLDGADTTNCIDSATCTARADGYTQEKATGNTCVTQAACSADNEYTITATKACSATCPSGELVHDLAGVKTCVTPAQCEAVTSPQHYVLTRTGGGISECVSGTECTGAPNSKFTVTTGTGFECVTSCPIHATHKYTFGTECIDAATCQAKTDGYTKNSTFTCVTSTECTGAGNVIIDDYHDCAPSCPTDFYKTSTGGCISAAECQTNDYTANFTSPKTCVTAASCTGVIIEDYKDCRQSCPSKPASATDDPYYLLMSSENKCIDLTTCKTKYTNTGMSYHGTTSNLCVDKAYCTSISSYADTVTQDCSSTCPSPRLKYNPAGEFECVEPADCTGSKSSYIQASSGSCLTKSECTTDGGVTKTGDNNCLANCPTGEYKKTDDSTCVDVAGCKSASRNTLNSTSTCITDTECTDLGRAVIADWKDCGCGSGKAYFDKDSGNCLTHDECRAQTDKVTLNSTNLCVTLQECTDGGNFVLDMWDDCVADCSVSAATPYNLQNPTTNKCVSNQMCVGASDSYIDSSANECISSSECDTKTKKVISETSECVDSCSSPYTLTTTDSKGCYTPNGCAAASGMFTKNDTNHCVTKSECTGSSYRTINDWSDCLQTCAGDHLFYEEDDSLCLTETQCKSKTSFLTKKDTNDCVSETKCITVASYKKVMSAEECVPDCLNEVVYKYQLGSDKDQCVSATTCQGLSDGYTSNKTGVVSECITKAECEALPDFIVPSYHDCVDSCPSGYYLDGNECRNKAECTAKGFYTNSVDTPATCVQSCPAPLYHDFGTFNCVSSCPDGKLKKEDTRFCYTREDCFALGEDFWSYPEDSTCQEGCTLYKYEGFKNCIEKVECPGKTDDVNKKCYVEIIVNKKTSETASETNESASSRNGDNIEIVLNLDQQIQQSLDFIEKITYSQKQPEINNQDTTTTRRILQSTTETEISSFSLTPVENEPGVYKVIFTSPYNLKFYTTIYFKKNFEVYSQQGTTEFPALYRIDIEKEIYLIPPTGEVKSFALSESVALVYDTLAKTLPLIGTGISMVSKLRFTSFISNSYNKVSIYNRAASQDINDQRVKMTQNETFIDWGASLNRFIFKQINDDIVIDDVEKICEDYEAKNCYNRHPANFIFNKAIWLILLIIFVILITKRRFRFGLIPVLWYSSQLFVIHDVVYNLSYLEFKGTIHIIGLILATFSLLGIITFSILFIFKKDKMNEYYKMDLFENLFWDLFNSRELMGEYFLLKLGFDILLTINVVVLRDSPKIQGIIFLVLELINLASTFRFHFKHLFLKIRTIAVNSLYLILAIFTFILGITSSTNTGFFDYTVFIISWLILLVEFITWILSLIILKTREDKPYKKENDYIETRVQESKPPDEPEIKAIPSKKMSDKAPSKVSKDSFYQTQNNFLLNGRAFAYGKKKKVKKDTKKNILKSGGTEKKQDRMEKDE